MLVKDFIVYLKRNFDQNEEVIGVAYNYEHFEHCVQNKEDFEHFAKECDIWDSCCELLIDDTIRDWLQDRKKNNE